MKEYKILFIGNSFTYFNDMPNAIFGEICRSAGYNVIVDSVTHGGYHLYKHADPADPCGKLVEEKLNENKYDYIILQEQSGSPVATPGLFYDGVRALAKKASENGAKLFLYETWGYKEGYSKLTTHGGDTVKMEMMLRAAYTAIGEEIGAEVIYVGAAMTDIYVSHKEINTYASDLFHPSAEGSTLAAFTIFSRIFGADPRQISYNGVCASDEAAKALKAAAYSAVFGENPIDEKYKTSSLGI